MPSFLQGVHVEVELGSYMITVCLTSWEMARLWKNIYVWFKSVQLEGTLWPGHHRDLFLDCPNQSTWRDPAKNIVYVFMSTYGFPFLLPSSPVKFQWTKIAPPLDCGLHAEQDPQPLWETFYFNTIDSLLQLPTHHFPLFS